MFTNLYNIVVNDDIRCKQNSRGRVPRMGLESRLKSCRLNISSNIGAVRAGFLKVRSEGEVINIHTNEGEVINIHANEGE